MFSETTTKSCPQCQQKAELHFRVGDVNRRISDELFDYYRCGSCGLLFLAPMPPDLGRYYQGDYYGLPGSVDELRRRSRPERYKIDLIKQHMRSGRLIEIGPATGGFCLLAKEAGFDVHAIEMDATCSKFLRDVVGVAVENSNEEVVALNRLASADVIALWHVIEHLRDPWAMIDAIAGKLRDGGIALIAAPNPHSWQFGLWKKRWTHVDAPRHVVLIPPEVLVRRMEARGLKLVTLTTADPGGIGWNRFGWAFGFANVTSDKWLKRILRVMGNIVGAMTGVIEDKEGRGAAYTAIFRKDGR